MQYSHWYTNFAFSEYFFKTFLVKVQFYDVYLFGFYGISTFVGYLMPNLFYTKKQYYFRQFGLAKLQSWIVKEISISSYPVY